MTAIRATSVLSVILLLPAARANAQASLNLSADLVAGGGPRSQRTSTSWFRGSGTPYGGLSLKLTGPRLHNIRPFVAWDHSVILESGDEVSLCSPAPDGTCFHHFPRAAGDFVGFGVRSEVRRWVDVGFAAGAGSMGGSSRYVDGELIVRLTEHLRAPVMLRHIVIRQPAGDQLWWRPIVAGLRIQ